VHTVGTRDKIYAALSISLLYVTISLHYIIYKIFFIFLIIKNEFNLKFWVKPLILEYIYFIYLIYFISKINGKTYGFIINLY